MMTDWTEINVEISHNDVDMASDICHMAVPYGIYIEDYFDLLTEAPKIAHVDFYDEELLKKDPNIAIIHIYISPDENPLEAISYLKDRFEAMGLAYSINTKSVVEEEWATAWKKYYHPTRLSDNLVVCPSWEEYEKEKPTDKILTLDPGMAFGTGTHDTTRLCVKLLDKYSFQGMEMLDVGCGSGILAITATLLGSGRTVGVDIDELAVRVAKENAALNNAQKVEFICGDLVEKVEGKFDVICANIVADVIIRLAPDIAKFLKENGIIILSGIIDERENDVVEALNEQGLVQKDKLSNKGWVALAYSWR
ncbi:MAG: 50S ribosomal protein L11 methyltransferase [Oscillospiraceae bacterium]